jgi:CheY-like chemotaxis protein
VCEYLRRGTRTALRWSVSDSETNQPRPGGPDAPSGPVLVVDDEPNILEVVQAALEDEGFAVLTAGNGAAALAVLDDHTPCVILLDLQMPGMDGRTFVHEYRRRAAQGPVGAAPIIAFTASRMPDEGAADLDLQGVLRKPFELDRLVEVVGHYAAGGGPHPAP